MSERDGYQRGLPCWIDQRQSGGTAPDRETSLPDRALLNCRRFEHPSPSQLCAEVVNGGERAVCLRASPARERPGWRGPLR